MITVSEQNHGQPLADPSTGAPTGAAKLLVSAVNALIKRTGGVSGKAFGPLPSYTVATLPSASANARCWIWVSDETGGATAAISDGTNWRRMQDRAVVS
jgi:hypothetical protein